MALETIHTLLRPGYPRDTIDQEGYHRTLEYVGAEADLRAAGCIVGAGWGEHPGLVRVADLIPIEGSEQATLSVRMSYRIGTAEYPSGGVGDLQETNQELDWVDVQRSLFEHPKFATGGTYALSNADVIQVKKWEQMPDVTMKAAYQYITGDPNEWDGTETGTATLSTNAQKLAEGMLKSVDYWVDKAPVARLSETYENGPGPRGYAGLKETPSGYDNLPSGYEWIRSGDSETHTGGQTTWRRDIEWLGAEQVLIDKENIYW